MSLKNRDSILSLTSIYSNRYQAKPDGYAGWMIVWAAFMISLLIDGFIITTGQFYEQFLLQYHRSEAATSLIISIMNALIYFIIPLASGMTKVYGCRVVALLGSLIAFTGMVLSFWLDESIYYHYFTLGLITGSGLGMQFIPQMFAVTTWFDRRLPLATGLAQCGSGFGMAVFAWISEHLITLYTWRGAMLMMAGLMSTAFIWSVLLIEPGDHENRFTNLFHREKFFDALEETINIELLKNHRTFRLYVAHQFLFTFAAFYPIIVASDRLRHLRMEPSTTSIYVLYGFASGFCRIVFGWLSYQLVSYRLGLYIVCNASLGLSIWMTVFFQPTVLTMQISYCLIGAFTGSLQCITTLILVDLYGSVQLGNAYANMAILNGFAILIGPPVLNLAVDKSKPFLDIYATPIWISGFFVIVSALMLLPMPGLQQMDLDEVQEHCFSSFFIKCKSMAQADQQQEEDQQERRHLIKNN